MVRNPRPIGDVLAELMARKGFARVQSSVAYRSAWREAAGELIAKYTRIGKLRRGTLNVIVGHSALVQELTFQKPALLKKLKVLLPDEGIRDLRFRLGAI